MDVQINGHKNSIPAEQGVRPIWIFLKKPMCFQDIFGSSDIQWGIIEIGAVVSKYDQAIFTWYFGNKLQSIIACHVDDFCFAGSEIF